MEKLLEDSIKDKNELLSSISQFLKGREAPVMEKIHIRDVLNLLEEKYDTNGNPITNKITYVTYSDDKRSPQGRIKTVSNGQKSGLRYDMKKNMLRGITDLETGQSRAASIWLLTYFNNKQIVW